MFLPSIKNNEIKLFLSRETGRGAPENRVTDRVSAEIPIKFDFDRNADGGFFGAGNAAPFGDARAFRDGAFFGPRSSAAPFGGIERRGCRPPLFEGRGFCGRARRIDPPDPNVCVPFGCKNYVAPPDASFLEFIDDETHISPRCRGLYRF
jgi:hypothetical protein